MIELINDTINKNDIDDLIEWLKTYPRLTKGVLTTQFEKEFAKWLGTEYAVYVNSGSSANLIMLYVLVAMNLMKNTKVVVPALSWVTDLAPVIQFDLTPILCDCNMDNLSVDLNHLENIFKKDSPAALMLVSVLGLSPDMDAIVELCEKYDVILLEDNCESLGAIYKGKKLGNFGLMSTTSLYFGHHISTIEGGMIFTNNTDVYNCLLSLRSHGWNRDWNTDDKKSIEERYNIIGINAMYTFYYAGFNVRATDLQAFIGLNQLNKLDEIIVKRNANFKTYLEELDDSFWKPKEIERSYTSNFAYPIISKYKDDIVNALIRNDIQTRPLICGSMGNQPFYIDLYGKKSLYHCDMIEEYGIYLPNHPGLNTEDIKFISNVVNGVIKK
jgi:CDP-6-deoxy-D-xylo-4-hexulose-3-dehydrase